MKLFWFVLLLYFSTIQTSAEANESLELYLSRVRPLLREKCTACHGPLKQNGGLRLDTVAAIRTGGDSGPAVIPGDLENSLLLGAMSGAIGFRMPPDGQGSRCEPVQLEHVRQWIRSGAHGPAEEQPQPGWETHWSYQPVQRPIPPTNVNQDWCRNEIDRFISAGHLTSKISPQPETAPEVWLRRVHLDLTGLPPRPETIERFLRNPGESARRRIVDRLLNSPRYGERWARHWMDVWRYSDWYGSRGINEIRYSQRHIWRWRDWIIQSLNADAGYDWMLSAMLAGDEQNPLDRNILPAGGFLGRNWYKFDRNVMMFDMAEHTAQAFLAVTLRCARCHDHKYDPIEHRDYYRFRAFFEPIDVRTDLIRLDTPTQKDATLGQVPVDGIARVFDRHPDRPTYLFERGDDRFARKDQPIVPGVPNAFGTLPLKIQPVELPVASWYPALDKQRQAERRAGLRNEISKAESVVKTSRIALHKAMAAEQEQSGRDPEEPEPFLADSFDRLDKQCWEPVSGKWFCRDGHLVQSQVGNFATIISRKDHPSNFRCRVRYRTLQPGSYRSVGISFDRVDAGQSQDVYTSTGDRSQSVQAFHRDSGRQIYPQAGIVRTALKVGEKTELEFVVRGRRILVHLNGELKLDYAMPMPRQAGRLALWVHAGAAEFEDIEVLPLVPSRSELEQTVLAARHELERSHHDQKIARGRLTAWEARLAAELARTGRQPAEAVSGLARTAASASLELQLLEQSLKVMEATQNCESLSLSSTSSVTSESTAALTEARQKQKQEQEAWELLAERRSDPGTEYPPLGEMHPSSSTGRRSALARWMIHPRNPRTARVAVNYIWMWHFGKPLVSAPDNFGLNGSAPSHPELLDWLAAELMSHQWQMKWLHRRILLSSTYRLSSSRAGVSAGKIDRDPENRMYWRMPEKRMDAETVRDAILAVSGTLGQTLGGPEEDETADHQSSRRSLYFRNTPNEKMPWLETFDMANPNQCYRRRESVVPQQALALLNHPSVINQSRRLARRLSRTDSSGTEVRSDEDFIQTAYWHVLSRAPRPTEREACLRYLSNETDLSDTVSQDTYPEGLKTTLPGHSDPRERARENLVLVLFNHHEFITIR